MTDANTSAELLALVRNGDGCAAEAIFERYAGRLIGLARARLSRKLAARTDPEDIALSAWRSFFVGAREGRFVLARGGDLWRLLAEITLHKLCRQARQHSAGRRSVAAERPLDVVPEEMLPALNREMRPEEAAAITDEIEAVMRSLDAFGRRVLEMRLQGEAVEAIAVATGKSERTVRRTLAEIRDRLSARREHATGDRPRGRSSGVRRTGTTERLARRGRPEPRIEKEEASQPSESAARLTDRAPLRYADYLLRGMIGAGGFGKVYEAWHRPSGRRVAVKYLRKSFWRRAEIAGRFLVEAEMVARLRHPGIVAVRGAGATPAGGYFLAMDLIDGPDLMRVLRDGPVRPRDAVRWVIDACAAVAFAHDRGVIHCDLKPANLLLGPDGRVRVTDFGLARNAADRVSLGGTLPFMAPEQLDPAGMVGPRTDVYGLGVVLRTLLTGTPQNSVAGAATPEALASIVKRCTAECPDSRYATAADLAADLSSVGPLL